MTAEINKRKCVVFSVGSGKGPVVRCRSNAATSTAKASKCHGIQLPVNSQQPLSQIPSIYHRTSDKSQSYSITSTHNVVLSFWEQICILSVIFFPFTYTFTRTTNPRTHTRATERRNDRQYRPVSSIELRG